MLFFTCERVILTAMPSQPLVIILLLFFLIFVLAALAVWFALTINWRSQAEVEPEAEPKERRGPKQQKAKPTKPIKEVSNDNFRGARVSRKQDKDDSGDPFERFIRSKNDDLEF